MGKKHRALVFDDSRIAARMTQAYLADVGFEVRIATSLDEFASANKGFEPSVVLTDLGIPEIGMRPVCEVLRRRFDLGGTPIWLMSGIQHAKLVQAQEEQNAAGCISKIADPNEIRCQLKRLIEELEGHAPSEDERVRQSFLGEFRRIAQERLSSANLALDRWEKDTTHQPHLADLTREFHTLKGEAQLLGLQRIHEMVCDLEQMVSRLPKGQHSDPVVQKMRHEIVRVRALVSNLEIPADPG